MICTSLQLPLLEKGEVAFIAEDDMVQKRDAEKTSRLPESLGHLAVLPAWFKTSAGVVVCDDDGSSTLFEGNRVDFYLCVVDDTIRLLLGGAPRG
jgi:hypothetical protein